MKILKRNWINLIGFFVSTFLYAIVLNLNDTNVSRNLFQSILPALILIFLSGVMFWALFIILPVVLDLILIVKDQSNLTINLLIEWAIISSPFIYRVIKYEEWVFGAAIIAFLITQIIRRNRIRGYLKA